MNFTVPNELMPVTLTWNYKDHFSPPLIPTSYPRLGSLVYPVTCKVDRVPEKWVKATLR